MVNALRVKLSVLIVQIHTPAISAQQVLLIFFLLLFIIFPIYINIHENDYYFLNHFEIGFYLND